MDYNMDYDHDNIAQNHGNPDVVFMVLGDAAKFNVTEKRFRGEQYDDSVAYQQSFLTRPIDSEIDLESEEAYANAEEIEIDTQTSKVEPDYVKEARAILSKPLPEKPDYQKWRKDNGIKPGQPLGSKSKDWVAFQKDYQLAKEAYDKAKEVVQNYETVSMYDGIEMQTSNTTDGTMEMRTEAQRLAFDAVMKPLRETKSIEVVEATDTDVQRVLNDSEEVELQAFNDNFNDQLQKQINGTLPQGHIYQLGRPSIILQSVGIPNLPIELSANRLVDKSLQENHPFELSEVSGLVNAIHNPLAVFRSATHLNSFVVLTEIEHHGRKFVAALRINAKRRNIEINDIRSIYPKKQHPS